MTLAAVAGTWIMSIPKGALLLGLCLEPGRLGAANQTCAVQSRALNRLDAHPSGLGSTCACITHGWAPAARAGWLGDDLPQSAEGAFRAA